MILGSGLLQSTGPSFGTVTADSSDSALLAGQDALVCVYDGAAHIYFGKASGIWKTLWVDTTGALLRGDEAGTYAVTLASDGPAPFDVAYGFATDRKAGSVAAGTAFSHEGDCVLEFTVTTMPSSDNIRFNFRKVDAQNFWRLLISAGGNFDLYEIIANSFNQRATASSVVSSGHHVVIIADSTTIKGHSNDISRWTYSSATNFATATAGELQTVGTGGVVSDLIAWPRVATTVATILDKVSA